MYKNNLKHWGKAIALAFVLMIPVLMFFSIIWFASTWSTMTVSELLYHLFSPLEGTGDSVIQSFIYRCAAPALVVWIVLSILFKINWTRKRFRGVSIVLAAIIFVSDVVFFLWKIGFYNYVTTIRNGSSYIEENYVDPATVDITFPDKKRNLIYIFLESMETSYSDTSHGGAFDYNVIPELTALASEGENFSGNKSILNGGYSLPGTDWTAAGIIAQTSGLPIQVQLGTREGDFDEGYYQSVVSLGDILNQNGYHQYFMCGSDAEFGGRKQYLTAHGNYEIDDYSYAVGRGWFDPNERDDWGFSDQKLFEFAKKRLTEIAQDSSNEPFNFTLLTVDTHFAGKICELCQDEFDNSTQNVYACSNRQTVEFVRWIQQQQFYDNTTIILCGDHTTMDASISNLIGGEYDRRTYTLYLNAPIIPKQIDADRHFSTLDQFPTTLAALGAVIDGNRLGLGTNLFSDVETLTEQDGLETERKELSAYSPFLAKLSGLDASEIMAKEEEEPNANTIVEIDENTGKMHVKVSDLGGNVRKILFHLDVRYYSNGEHSNEKVIKMKKRNGVYFADIPLDDIELSNFDLNIFYKETRGEQYQIYGQSGDARLKQRDFCEYIDALKTYISSGDYAACIVAVKHNSMKAMSESELSKLRELGLKVEMSPGEGNSYCAVVEKDRTLESIDDQMAILEGKLSDGTSYKLSSNWKSEKLIGYSLRIDEHDKIVDRTGIQIVVFNMDTKEVADFVCFNLDSGETTRRVEFGE